MTDTVRPRPRSRNRIVLDGQHVRLVIVGKQSAALRPTKPSDDGEPYAVGEVVAVCKLGGKRVCSVRVDSIRRRPLGELGMLDARSLGYRTLHAWRAAWMRQHDPMVRGLTGPDLDAFLDDEQQITDRFTARWHDVPVWHTSFTFQPDLDQRFLAAAGHATNSDEQGNTARGYTTNPALALPDEGSAVDDATLEVYAQDARARHAKRATDRRAEAAKAARDQPDDLAMRLTALRTIAAQKGLNIEGDVKALTDRINKLARKVKEAA